MKKIVIGIVIAVAITLVVVFASPFTIPVAETPETTETHIYIDGKIVVGGDGEPIELINNPNAINPTYAELLAFLESDQTDKFSYILGPPKNAYVCADFARDVHNNAEAAGIRAAWVGIDVEGEAEGHAINAFETTDIGLVYIDCTGKGLWDELPTRTSFDRRAYVKIGEPYKVADANKARECFKFFGCTPFEFDQFGSVEGRLESNLGEETLRNLQELGWIREPGDAWIEEGSYETLEEFIEQCEQLEQRNEEWRRKHLQVTQWIQTHDIQMLGEEWVQDWMQDHEAELSRCGHELKVDKEHVGWRMDVYCLETPWFQPEEELRMVDGIPIIWKVWRAGDWECYAGWHRALGIVQDIHIHW